MEVKNICKKKKNIYIFPYEKLKEMEEIKKTAKEEKQGHTFTHMINHQKKKAKNSSKRIRRRNLEILL